MFGKAEELVERLRDIRSDLASSEKEVKGLLSIGATSIPGSYVIPPIAAEFSRSYPDVFFQVTISDTKKITEAVTRREQLLGIVDHLKEVNDIDAVLAFRDELVLVAAPGFIGKKEISPLKLFSLPLLMREEGSDSRTRH